MIENDATSDLALEITQAVLAKSEEAQSIMEDQSGPLALAGALESGAAQLEQEELNEVCAYRLDLLDRLDFLVHKIKIMDQRDTVARMFASMGVWVARHGATIDNLQGTADGFGIIVNGTTVTDDLRTL